MEGKAAARIEWLLFSVLLLLTGFFFGWHSQAIRVARANARAEQEWREKFEKKKQKRLTDVREACKEAKSDVAKAFCDATIKFIENSDKPSNED